MNDSTNSNVSKRNGSSGFISFEESFDFEKRTIESTTSSSHEVYKYQNQLNSEKLLKLRHNRSLPANAYIRHVSRSREEQFKPPDSSTPQRRHSLNSDERPPELAHVSDERWAELKRFREYYDSLGPMWWLNLPKTDYLYSRSSPWYGSELAPGIPRIPNLTRRSYRLRGNARFDPASLLTPPSSPDASNGSLFDEALTATESSWSLTVRRVRHTVSRTVRTVVSSTVSTVSAAASAAVRSTTAVSTVCRQRLGLSNPWLVFLLFILLPLILALYYLFFGQDFPSPTHFSSHREFYSHPTVSYLLTELSKPYYAIWGGIVSLGSSLVDGALLIPALLRDLVLMVPWVYHHYFLVYFNHNATGVSSRELFDHSVRISKLEEKVGTLDQRVSSLESAVSLFEKFDEHDIMNKIYHMIEEKMKEGEQEQAGKLAIIYNRLKTLENAAANVDILKPEDRADLPEDFRGSVIALVQELLETYHADRTGKTDYAMSSYGAAIASIRCTRPYVQKSVKQWYGPWDFFNTWTGANPPETILKPGVMPGECWAFEGANGYVAVQLSLPIYVTGFTMEHTPKALAPYGHVESAPRAFSVWGLENLEDREETFLGRFEFLDNGKSLQSYDAILVNKPFSLIELRIESNHGHLEYTCLYRFRVHGRPGE